jgi:hypothetical protein
MNPQRQTIRGVDGDVTSGVAARRSDEHPSQKSSEGAERRMPLWMERLLHLHAPEPSPSPASLVRLHLHQVLTYCRNRGQDKLDVQLLASEYLDILRRSEPAIEAWKVE